MPFPSNYQKSASKREANYTADAKNAKVQKRAMTQKRNHEAEKRAAAVTLTQMMRDMKERQQEDTGGAERTKRSRTCEAERTKRSSNGEAEQTERSSNGEPERTERSRTRDTEWTERSRADSAKLAGDAQVCAQRHPWPMPDPAADLIRGGILRAQMWVQPTTKSHAEVSEQSLHYRRFSCINTLQTNTNSEEKNCRESREGGNPPRPPSV